MRRLITRFVAAFLFVVIPHVASAQAPTEGERSWLLSPSLALALDEDADASLAISGALGYPLTRTLAIEGELGHAFDLVPSDPDVDSSLTTFHGTLLYFFPTEYRITPYLAGGLGIAKFSQNTTDPATEIDSTEIGFNLGGGVTYPLGDRLWARGDFRFFKHIDDLPTVWRFAGGVTIRLGP